MENALKTKALATLGVGGIAALLGGWDMLLQTLVILMVIDYLTGVFTAIVRKRLSSAAGFHGIARKACMLLVVVLGVCLDSLSGAGSAFRSAVCLFYIANEGLSVVENLSLLGVPFPTVVKNALSRLKEEDKAEKESGEKGGS